MGGEIQLLQIHFHFIAEEPVTDLVIGAQLAAVDIIELVEVIMAKTAQTVPECFGDRNGHSIVIPVVAIGRSFQRKQLHPFFPILIQHFMKRLLRLRFVGAIMVVFAGIKPDSGAKDQEQFLHSIQFGNEDILHNHRKQAFSENCYLKK